MLVLLLHVLFLLKKYSDDSKTDNELNKPVTSILHEEDALDYDEYDDEKSEGTPLLSPITILAF